MSHFAGSVTFGEDTLPRPMPQASSRLGCDVFFHGLLVDAAEMRVRLRSHLRGVGHDSHAIVAAAYRTWGPQLQRHLTGEFCMAVIDSATGRAMLSHDGLGLRPIYYAVSDSTLHFGSRAKDVAALLPGDRLDDAFILEYLTDAANAGYRTVYHDVKRLPPGMTLIWERQAASLQRSWTLTDIEPLSYRQTSDYDEHFRSVLGHAIRERQGRHTWAELSGGLDSSSIVSVAARDGRTPLETVSYVYSRSKTADERAWIQHLLDRYALPWHPIDVDARAPFAEMPDRPLDQPTRAIAMWGQFAALDDLVGAHGVDVLLSGFGGDQVMGGDGAPPAELADHLMRCRLRPLWTGLHDWQAADREQRPLRYHFLRLAAQPAYRFARRQAVFPRSVANATPWLRRGFVEGVRRRRDLPPAPRQPTVARQYLHDHLDNLGYAVPELWNQLTDRLDIRYPLLDRQLIEFMLAIPYREKVQPGQDRVLQRRALTGVLPPQIQNRRDKCGPDEAILRGYAAAYPGLRERLTEDPVIVQRGYADRQAWAQAVDGARVGRIASLHRFLSTVSLELWLQSRR